MYLQLGLKVFFSGKEGDTFQELGEIAFQELNSWMKNNLYY